MNYDMILASKSPRRKELLEECGLTFRIETLEHEEIFMAERGIEKAIEEIAYQKAKGIAQRNPETIVLGADTMVCFQGQVLGKPKDEEDAYQMLKRLSGNTHEVITGVALLIKDQEVIFHETCKVTFYELEEELIRSYIETKEPMDKAGAYGIQSLGRLLVKGIVGDYFNVVGLPVARIYREIKKLQNL